MKKKYVEINAAYEAIVTAFKYATTLDKEAIKAALMTAVKDEEEEVKIEED